MEKILEFGIHRKNTHNDNFIKSEGHNPIQHKHAVINSLTHRLVNIPMNESEYNKEYNHIIRTATKNGYSTDLVNKKINKFKNQIKINSNHYPHRN